MRKLSVKVNEVSFRNYLLFSTIIKKESDVNGLRSKNNIPSFCNGSCISEQTKILNIISDGTKNLSNKWYLFS